MLGLALNFYCSITPRTHVKIIVSFYYRPKESTAKSMSSLMACI